MNKITRAIHRLKMEGVDRDGFKIKPISKELTQKHIHPRHRRKLNPSNSNCTN